jgi:hypothetical protein
VHRSRPPKQRTALRIRPEHTRTLPGQISVHAFVELRPSNREQPAGNAYGAVGAGGFLPVLARNVVASGTTPGGLSASGSRGMTTALSLGIRLLFYCSVVAKKVT